MNGEASDARKRAKKRRRGSKRRRKRAAEAQPDVASTPDYGRGSVLYEQRRLALAATVTIIGLGLVGTGESMVGVALTLLGALNLIWAIHRYGRLGTEGV